MKSTEQEINEAAKKSWETKTNHPIYKKNGINPYAYILGYKSGFNEAISQMQPEWVSVTEREPIENQEVEVCFEHLVYHESGDIIENGVTSAVFSRTELLRPVFSKVNGWVVLGVTHWKPLSQPLTK